MQTKTIDRFGSHGKQVFIYGLGITGLETAQQLTRAGEFVVCWDDQEDQRQAALAAGFALADPSRLQWNTFSLMVKSPGIPLKNAVVTRAIQQGVAIVSDLDLLWRREQGRAVRFIGITGTNGKSTTTALVGHVLAAAGAPVAVGGNIGRAALTLPELEDGGFYVLECSSYQLETTSEMKVDAGVVLNLTSDHLERHGNMEAYAAVKLQMLLNAKPDAYKLVGVDQQVLAEPGRRIKGVKTLSLKDADADVFVDSHGFLVIDGEKVADLTVFKQLSGPHNWQNMAAVVALLRRWLSVPTILACMKSFAPLPHRMQPVGDVDGVLFVNDSKATNGDSTVPALESYRNTFWICGGRPKLDGLGDTVAHLANVRMAFTIGEAGPAFAEQLRALGVVVMECGTLDVAVREAFLEARQLPEPACVLLSPACASQDQFANFEQRGDVFVRLVNQLREAV